MASHGYCYVCMSVCAYMFMNNVSCATMGVGREKWLPSRFQIFTNLFTTSSLCSVSLHLQWFTF